MSYEEKVITVLDRVDDIESVVAKYKRKGWLVSGTKQVPRNAHDPRSVQISFRRVKSKPTSP